MRFLSCMNSLMNHKIIFVSEAFVTFTTFVRLLSCMNYLMTTRTVFVGETSGTFTTFVRFLSTIGLFQPEYLCRVKNFIKHYTIVLFLSYVDSLM